MRFVALVSGGKDSIYSTLECIRNGHQLVACIHLGRPEAAQEESYMYQTAASEVVRTLVEECLGVPLLLHQRVGTSVNTSLIYDGNYQPTTSTLSATPTTTPTGTATTSTAPDEVEDLFQALQNAKEQFENIEAVSSGAILSTYQRVRIENVCSRLGLTSLSYLWRLLPQKELLQQMLDERIEAVLVKTACPPGLIPQKHLNQTLRFLWDTGLLERLHQRFQFHVCGEGGEYESLVIDSPLHQKKLVLDLVEIEESDDGVGDLKILQCHAENKTENDVPILWSPSRGIHSTTFLSTNATPASDSTTPLSSALTISPKLIHIPHVKYSSGGLFHVSEIMASVAASSHESILEADLAVQEAQEILSILQKTLELNGSHATDVVFVHLYLSEISHFANINAHYQTFFGTILPPSRSCVAVGKGVLPGGRRVLLDCLVQPGSGEYMRTSNNITATSNPYASAAHATKTSKLRDVLHVQSISYWAPVCVGPYSQVNTLRSGLHFFAGQIGLVPATMQLQPTWTLQLDQSWKNVAAVLDALDGGSLRDMISGMIYVSHSVYQEEGSLGVIEATTRQMLQTNGSVVSGRIDAIVDETDLYGGYEDAGTWEEMKAQQGEISDINTDKNGSCPILVVSIPEMPKGATIEVEIIAATKAATRNLEISQSQFSQNCMSSTTSIPKGWDTGHTFATRRKCCKEGIQIDALVNVLGHRNVATALVSASVEEGITTIDLEAIDLMSDMLMALSKVLAEGRSGFDATHVIQLRLFHTATELSSRGEIQARDDGLHIRTAFQGAIARWANNLSLPAYSTIPVHAIAIINAQFHPSCPSQTILAMQALLLDTVHLETDIWIHKDREYSN